MIDIGQAKLFLSILGSPPYVFQTFTDNKVKRNALPQDPLARVLIGTLEEHSDALTSLSVRGAGVFIQINAGQKRGAGAVSQIRAVFVDIDEPNRANATLAVVSKNMPKPSVLVNSSPGKYHLYWIVTGVPLEKFGIYQKHLASRFLTDTSMSNLDRVMRLPGFPHQKYTPVPVTLRKYGTTYEVQQLEKALREIPENLVQPVMVPPAPTERIPPPPPPKEKKSDNPFGIDIGEGYEAPISLPPGDRTSKLIRHIGWLVSQGNDAEYVREEIMRMNLELCPPGEIPIAPPTLEQEVLGCVDKFIQNRTEEIRKVHGDAFADAESVKEVLPAVPPPPAIVELMAEPELPSETLSGWLTRFIYVVDKKRVADSHVMGEWAVMAWEEFEKEHIGKFVAKNKRMSAAWLAHPDRLTVRGVSYKPTAEPIITNVHDQKFFNGYQPPELAPAFSLDMTKLQVFMDHIIYLFPKPLDRDAFLGWFCFTVTQPLKKCTWAPVLVSAQGTGKGWLLDVMKILMGDTNVKPITPDRIENQFNSFLFASTLVCIFDMYKSRNRQLDGKLKGFIDITETESNKKNVGERTERVYANFLIFCNNSDAVYVEPGDRRFWMVQLPDPKPKIYYDKLFTWLEDRENFSHLLKWCQDYKSQIFTPNAPPMSRLKQDMVNRNKSEVQVELESYIENREGPFAFDIVAFDSVLDYIEQTLNLDISKGSLRPMLSQVWGSISVPLHVERVMVNAGNTIKSKRVRCVRNLTSWNEKTKREIAQEASNSANAALRPRFTETKVEEVSSDKST